MKPSFQPGTILFSVKEVEECVDKYRAQRAPETEATLLSVSYGCQDKSDASFHAGLTVMESSSDDIIR